ARCEECGNTTAYWWLRQLRSADESETRFFRCTKCGRTWREYD
ncbi:MAG: transcription factor S, partial [Methanosarcinales archaeon]|nr:transcription factor S [Methanosarcinales archaeon]